MNPNYNPNKAGNLLYVATGIADPTGYFNAPYPDRLTTLDYKANIVQQTPIPSVNPDYIGISNEPHHMGFINDGNGIAFGGLVSIVHELVNDPPQSHPDIFYFDKTDPLNAVYTSGYTFNRSDPTNPLFASNTCLLYTSPSPRDGLLSRMPSSA